MNDLILHLFFFLLRGTFKRVKIFLQHCEPFFLGKHFKLLTQLAHLLSLISHLNRPSSGLRHLLVARRSSSLSPSLATHCSTFFFIVVLLMSSCCYPSLYRLKCSSSTHIICLLHYCQGASPMMPRGKDNELAMDAMSVELLTRCRLEKTNICEWIGLRFI